MVFVENTEANIAEQIFFFSKKKHCMLLEDRNSHSNR